MEVWKDIPNYEGHYQVSSLGNVKSFYSGVGIILRGIPNKGYLRVGLSKNKVKKKFAIHQLVAIAFLGHNPNGFKLVVNHKDFNILNNKVENLEIVTNRENSNQKHIPSTSKYVGVSRAKNTKKWMARIALKGKNKYLGSYDCELEASKAYQTELKKITNL